MPQVVFCAPIGSHVDIQTSVTIEVPPDRVAGIDPLTQFCLVGDPGKSAITIITKKLKVTPLIDEQILIAVVVVVGASCSCRDACTRSVYIGHARLLRDLFKPFSAAIHVKAVHRPDSAVGNIDIRPAIVIKITYRYGRSLHRLDPGRDVPDLRIKRRYFMNKVDPKEMGGFFELKAILPARIALMNPACDPWSRKQ